MAQKSRIAPAPKVRRIEVMPLDEGEAVAVIELESEPTAHWLEALQREMRFTEGLESSAAKVDGCHVYLLGLEPGLGRATRHVGRLLATVPAAAR